MQTVSPRLEQTWSLEDIFEDQERYEQVKQGVAEAIPQLDRWHGHISESAERLAEALETITETYKTYALLRSYTSLKSDVDTGIAAHQAMRQEIELLATDISGKVAWLRPEILAMAPETVERFIGEEPRLEPHAFFLRDLMRQRAHVLSPAEEKIVAETGLVTGGPSTLYQVLQNLELPRPELTLSDGTTTRLTPVEFNKHRTSPNREDRQRVFPAYYRAHTDFKDTLSGNLYSSVKTHMFRTRVRGYESCLASALDPDKVPVGVYHNLIRQVHEHLPVMQRYFTLRRRSLDLAQLEYADLYCPLGPQPPSRYTPARAQQLVLDSVVPIGEAYVAGIDRAFRERWINWHPSEGKRAGAYATGWAYDVHPYVLLNFTGEYDSVTTLAHEMGHAMHSFFSNRRQPFATSDYAIFVAEVASTVNEALLARSMIEAAGSPDEKAFLLASYVDGIRGTLFRQTMFAEFELAIHDRSERGEVLTSDLLNTMYLDLLRRYHGHDDGVMHIEDVYAIEWAAIPHFYYNFYVYQYATGIVAATALADDLFERRPGAAERYVEFLSAGGSDYPLELLRRAGVDLESDAPYASAFRVLERLLDELEPLIDAGRRA